MARKQSLYSIEAEIHQLNENIKNLKEKLNKNNSRLEELKKKRLSCEIETFAKELEQEGKNIESFILEYRSKNKYHI